MWVLSSSDCGRIWVDKTHQGASIDGMAASGSRVTWSQGQIPKT